ncbi:hypothetical protein EUTSA_v10015780mg [Eutrema salsugineum]|uniref:Prolamin-like domain-containing protein n=1 Tax=Eutrema salsugineum TaxID=72664 RepID=V4LPF6_EUTSA|nr:hypothetical protein EUTSA_v10015780mg [Eutrema salsugineum]
MKNLTFVFVMILFLGCATSQLLEATDDEDLQWWDSPLSTINGHHFRPSPELANAFLITRNKPTIGSESSDCCAAIKTLYKDCEKTVFGSFRNPFFNYYVKQHCSTQGGSTPVAPSPA